MEDDAPRKGCPFFIHVVEGRSPDDPWTGHRGKPTTPQGCRTPRAGLRCDTLAGSWEGESLHGDPQGVEGVEAGLGTSVTASRMTDAYGETVARRRSAALLSEFGLGHVREYAPFDLILSALHLILRAKSQHI